MNAEMMSFVCIAAVCAMAFADEPTAHALDTAEDGAGLVATARKWVSLSAFAEIQSAYLARGAVKASSGPEAKRDITVFGVGVSLNF